MKSVSCFVGIVVATFLFTSLAHSQTHSSFIEARADEFEGWPEIIVEVNGERVQTIEVSSRVYARYPLNLSLSAHSIVQLGLYYENERYERAGRDRNVFIRRVVIEWEEYATGRANHVGDSQHNHHGSLYQAGGLVWYRCEANWADWLMREEPPAVARRYETMSRIEAAIRELDNEWSEWQRNNRYGMGVPLVPISERRTAEEAAQLRDYFRFASPEFDSGRLSWLEIERHLGIAPGGGSSASVWDGEELADPPAAMGDEVREYLGEPPAPSADDESPPSEEARPASQRATALVRERRGDALDYALRYYATLASHLAAREREELALREVTAAILRLRIAEDMNASGACPTKPNPVGSE